MIIYKGIVNISDPEISLENGIPDLDLFATGNVDAYRSLITPSKNILPLIKSQFTSHFPPPIDIPVAGDDSLYFQKCLTISKL